MIAQSKTKADTSATLKVMRIRYHFQHYGFVLFFLFCLHYTIQIDSYKIWFIITRVRIFHDTNNNNSNEK